MKPRPITDIFNRVVILIIVCSLFHGHSIAQENIISENSFVSRQTAIAARPLNKEKTRADSIARTMNLPIRRESKTGSLIELQKIASSGLPVYYMSHNLNAAKSTGTDKLWNGNTGGMELDGSGIVVGMWDGGAVRPSHQEFNNRVRLIDYLAEKIHHATHIAGTIGATGVQGEARGMANNCMIDSYMWGNDSDEMDKAANEGLLVSNHSYGYLIGWHYNDEERIWEWYGDISISSVEDYRFGYYDQTARTWDSIAFHHPNYLIVKSAGNDRNEGPAPGTVHKYWTDSGWKRTSKIRYTDGNDGFDCIDPLATGKNILTIGAIDDIVQGPDYNPQIEVADFSVFGPADDGRIKPDIVGNGVDLYSPISLTDSSYALGSGTSMSAANISGSIALIQQYHFNLFYKYLNSCLMKGLIIHTAVDKGLTGPDYRFGWGLMNAAKCISIIENANTNNFFNAALDQGSENRYSYISDGNEDIKITICWTDPPGPVPVPSVDPENKVLVNDLDIRLIRKIDGKVFYPFYLSPDNPDAPAMSGDNELDNVEQIIVKNPLPGVYELVVSHKHALQNGEQDYGTIITGLHNELNANGTIFLDQPNGEILLTTAGNYQDNLSVKWIINPDNGLPIKLYFEQFSTEQNVDLLKVYEVNSEGRWLIAEFSGTLSNPDTLIQSSGNTMMLVFNSNGHITSSGFKAHYCTTAPGNDLTILGNTYPCENTTSDLFIANRDGSSYSWSSFRDYIISDLPDNGVRVSIFNLTDTLTIVPYNRCGEGNSLKKPITPLSSLPETSFINTDVILCGDKIVNMSVRENPGTEYHWNIPKTWWGQSDSAVLKSIPRRGEHTLSVVPENSCGIGDSVFLEMTILEKPDKDSIFTIDDPICKETLHVFYVKSQPHHSYKWKVYDDWKIWSGGDKDTAEIFVGSYANNVEITTTNKCGTTSNVELLQNEKPPAPPTIRSETNRFGSTLIYVSNPEKFDGIQWFFNDKKIAGTAGTTNPIITNRNGIYTVASVDENGCYNKLPVDKGVTIQDNKYNFLAYRNTLSTVIIENSSGSAAIMKVFTITGKLIYTKVVQPGKNEISFSQTGNFAISFVAESTRQSIKVFL